MPADDEQDWGKYLLFGAEIAVGTVLGLFVGEWIDKRFGSGPWGVLIGVLLGLSAGMYQMIREGIRINKD